MFFSVSVQSSPFLVLYQWYNVLCRTGSAIKMHAIVFIFSKCIACFCSTLTPRRTYFKHYNIVLLIHVCAKCALKWAYCSSRGSFPIPFALLSLSLSLCSTPAILVDICNTFDAPSLSIARTLSLCMFMHPLLLGLFYFAYRNEKVCFYASIHTLYCRINNNCNCCTM